MDSIVEITHNGDGSITVVRRISTVGRLEIQGIGGEIEFIDVPDTEEREERITDPDAIEATIREYNGG